MSGSVFLTRVLGVFFAAFLAFGGGADSWAQETLAYESGAEDTTNFSQWVRDFHAEALQAGISPQTLALALEGIAPDPRVVALDRKQPEGRTSFAVYFKNTVTPARLRKGRDLRLAQAAQLEKASQAYGVPASVIMALWGIESGFGSNMGSFSVVESLATLAYEGRRAAFFRNELIEALRILDEERMEVSAFTGSWAGAMGQCQFMPSTYRRFAVDADGDGRRDIWDSREDVFASIARYLAAEGWKAGESWGREVRLTKPLAPALVGLEVVKPVRAWRELGVVEKRKKSLPPSDIRASLVLPDGRGGRAFLVYDNFRAVMRWNRSTYFALTVGLLSDLLRAAPPSSK